MDGSRLLPAARAPLRVGVLVDLERRAASGGHVKCWERLSRAALAFEGEIDLTVHFAGRDRGTETLGPNVRHVFERPVFSTARLGFLRDAPDHADLAPWHGRIARALRRYDVVHTTDAFFAYARTAAREAPRAGAALVNSVHTNTPECARLYMRQLLGRIGLPALGLDAWVERRMRRLLAAHWRRCAFAFVARPAELPKAASATGGRAGLLRRGVDKDLFSPARRDRERLGVGAADVVVMYAGRLEAGKNVALLAEAVAKVPSVRLLCAGDGPERERIAGLLGARAILPGTVDAPTLAHLYASADLFAFPSEIEEHANVVSEALSSGLPVLVTPAMGGTVERGRTGLVLPGDDPRPWAAAIAALAADPDRRRAMGRAARAWAARHIPSWEDVLGADLLPRWREATLDDSQPMRRHEAIRR